MGNEKKEMPQNDGCCCGREKTWIEIVAERVTDPHEKEIIVREFARLREDNQRLEEIVNDLKQYNDGLCLEISRLAYQQKNMDCRDKDTRHEMSMKWFVEYLLREMDNEKLSQDNH